MKEQQESQVAKLKALMAELTELCKFHDVGAAIFLHLPGIVEMGYNLTPSYSAVYLSNGDVRIKSKLSDFNGDMAAKSNQLDDTINLFEFTGTMMRKVGDGWIEMGKKIDDKSGGGHKRNPYEIRPNKS